MSKDQLDGCRIIVTGGASGMGEGIVRAFPGLGARVVSLDINAETGVQITDAADAVGFVPVNVADQVSVNDAIARAVEMLGGLDVLVHAAGVAPGALAQDITLDSWERIMAINATGTFLTNQAVFPHLKQRGGSIINFASGAGVKGYPNKAAYAASKGAVVAWIRSIAVEWGQYGIRVNGIAPAIWTPMYDKTRSEMTAEKLALHDAVVAREVPIGGKLGDIQRDLVPVIAFLASNASQFMTGQILPVDGGKLMMR